MNERFRFQNPNQGNEIAEQFGQREAKTPALPLTLANIMNAPRLQSLLSIHRGGSGVLNPDWFGVEQALKLELPRSYKTLVDKFGASSWGDFLYILSPFDESVNLRVQGKQILDADRESRQLFPSHYPFSLHPEPNGLLPWAVTDNGDTLYFITIGLADDWPTLIRGPRAPEFEVSFLHPSLLVHHIAAGTFRSTILPQL